MNWIYEISTIDSLIIALFGLLYLAYGIRMYLISKKLSVSISRLSLKFLLRTTYLSLIFIALLGPSFGDIKKEIKSIGKDIYIAIDLSESMNANDIMPSRLKKTIYELNKALSALYADRIGLITFTDFAQVHCPLTYDHSMVTLFLESLSTKLHSSSGTNLYAALSLAQEKLSSSTESKRSVLVLITDGEDFGEQSTTILEKITTSGIAIVIVGIGSAKGSTIPTGINEFKKDTNNALVVSKLNDVYLRSICERTNGHYFEITPNKNEFDQVIQEIIAVEGSFNSARKIESSANKYFYFLFLGLILASIDVLITVKTTKL